MPPDGTAPADVRDAARRRRQHHARRGRAARGRLRGRLQERRLLARASTTTRPRACGSRSIGGEPVARCTPRRPRSGRGWSRAGADRAHRARRRAGRRLPADTPVGSAGSTSASRQTYCTGGAVQAACAGRAASAGHAHGDRAARRRAIDETREFRHRADLPARRQRAGRRARRSSRSPRTGWWPTSTPSSASCGSSRWRPRRTSARRSTRRPSRGRSRAARAGHRPRADGGDPGRATA